MAVLGHVYTLGEQTLRSLERCTSQNTTSAEFLEDPSHTSACPRVWLGSVGVLCQALETRKIRWEEEKEEEEYEKVSKMETG